jgi:glycerol kinase
LAVAWRVQRCFEPQMPHDQAAEKMAAWAHAVRQATAN